MVDGEEDQVADSGPPQAGQSDRVVRTAGHDHQAQVREERAKLDQAVLHLGALRQVHQDHGDRAIAHHPHESRPGGAPGQRVIRGEEPLEPPGEAPISALTRTPGRAVTNCSNGSASTVFTTICRHPMRSSPAPPLETAVIAAKPWLPSEVAKRIRYR